MYWLSGPPKAKFVVARSLFGIGTKPRMTEGFDTPDLEEAKALLEALNAQARTFLAV